MDEDEPIDLPFEPISNVVCVESGWPTAVALLIPSTGAAAAPVPCVCTGGRFRHRRLTRRRSISIHAETSVDGFGARSVRSAGFDFHVHCVRPAEHSAGGRLVCTLGHEPPTPAVTAAEVIDARGIQQLGQVHDVWFAAIWAMSSCRRHGLLLTEFDLATES